MDNNELQHWGVRGMKWGVRRYQNKDGTLTPAGKKRYEQELAKLKKEEQIIKNRKKTQAQIDKLEAKRRQLADEKRTLDENGKSAKAPKPTKVPKTSKSPEGESTSAKKSVRDMSDEELRQAVLRLTNEKKYQELNPVQKSRGKAFVEGMWNHAVQPALEEVAKAQLKKLLESSLDKATTKK